MLKKKFFAKALAFAMVMGTVGVHGMVAAPVGIVKAAVSEITVTVDAVTYEATIEIPNGEKSGYVCLKVLKENKKDAKVVSEAWYPVDSSTKKAVVDLSFLKAAKEQYIMAVDMSGNESEPFTIPAQIKTAIKFDAKTQRFVDKSKVEITDLDKYEYKTLYGSKWVLVDSTASPATSGLKDFKEKKLQNAMVAGTTIIVRKAADSTSNTPAGTEVKVKIPAIAKAPKVKVDYVKGTITLPKNVEIVLVKDDGTLTSTGSGANVATSWAKKEGKLTPDGLLVALGVATDKITETKVKGYSFAIRTAEVKDKKAASNMTFVKINPAPVIETDPTTGLLVSVNEINNGNVTKTKKITCTCEEDGLKLTPEPNVTGYSYSVDGRKWTPITGTVTVKVEDKAKVQICIPAVKGDDSHAAAFASNTVEVTYAKPASSTN